MISLENKFIFTHIGRTGGGSIENGLSEYGVKKPHKSPYFLNNSAIKFEASHHWTAVEEQLAVGKDFWNKCFKFTIVRNPWDRMLSQYTGHVYKEVPGMTFEEYIYRSFKDRVTHDDIRFISPCMDWITDNTGNILVDYIGRFETLQESFDDICSILQIPKSQLSHTNNGAVKIDTYRDYYSSEMIELVYSAFNSDIKQFGYKF